jgi:integrase
MAVLKGSKSAPMKSKMRITEVVRAARLRRADGELVPSVTNDTEVLGFSLIVTSRRAFWCIHYQPRGRRADGRRWGGGVRHELGDAYSTPLADARAEALAVKARVRLGEDPHRERMAVRAVAEADRALLPTMLSQALDGYQKAVMARREPSEATRRQSVHYARKAVRLMKAETLPLSRLDASMIRLTIEIAEGSAGERRHVFGGLSRFCDWLVEERMINANPCASVPRRARPKPGKARDHVPSLEELRAVWAAVQSEPAVVRDLIRFLLLTPLRRDEAAGLVWSEVDLSRGWIKIGADRMKNAEAHELPLAPEALEILIRRRDVSDPKPEALVFPSGESKPYDGWNRLLTRIRKAIGQGSMKREARFAPHDIRRGFSTHLAERFDENLLDLIIAHRPASRRGSGAAYQKAKRLNERPIVIRAWSALILGEKQAKQPDNALPFRAVR